MSTPIVPESKVGESLLWLLILVFVSRAANELFWDATADQDRSAVGGMKDEPLLMNWSEGSGYGVVLLGGITSGSSWLFSVGASGMVVGR
eukprot:scaffold33391_cov66-Cyclotella_meneghiniana.AAC.5